MIAFLPSWASCKNKLVWVRFEFLADSVCNNEVNAIATGRAFAQFN